jgi:hypothetical protein
MPVEQPKSIWGLSKSGFIGPDDINALNSEMEALFDGPWEQKALLTEELDGDTIAAI